MLVHASSSGQYPEVGTSTNADHFQVQSTEMKKQYNFLLEIRSMINEENEDELDHNALHKKVSWKSFSTKYYIERQAHGMYNISIFRKFQLILNDVTRL